MLPFLATYIHACTLLHTKLNIWHIQYEPGVYATIYICIFIFFTNLNWCSFYISIDFHMLWKQPYFDMSWSFKWYQIWNLFHNLYGKCVHFKNGVLPKYLLHNGSDSAWKCHTSFSKFVFDGKHISMARVRHVCC